MFDDPLPEALPHSDDAERSVLGAILVDNRLIHRAQELLRPDSFYAARHRRIFQAMEELAESGTAIDLVTLRQALERTGDLDGCGGVGYLASLVDGLPRSAHLDHYAIIVKEMATRREMILASREIAVAAMRQGVPLDQVLEEAERAIFRVSQERLKGGFVPLRVVAEESLRVLEELTQRQELITGIATGFRQLDELTAGLQPSDLIVLAARPSVGKTALALNLVAHVALRQGSTVGFVSLEMSRDQVLRRLLCAEARVDAHRLRTGRIREEDWRRILKVYARLNSAPIFLDDSPGMSILELRAKARRLKLEHGLDLLVVDYLQLLRGRTTYENRQQEIADISRSLKELAKELAVPVVALSQLTRQPELRRGDHRPQLSDLRESGAIEQDADVVLFLYREEMYRKDDPDLKGKAELIVAKQRNGPTDTVHLNFIAEYASFVNPEWREY
jgi:replicative DNA helicase